MHKINKYSSFIFALMASMALYLLFLSIYRLHENRPSESRSKAYAKACNINVAIFSRSKNNMFMDQVVALGAPNHAFSNWLIRRNSDLADPGLALVESSRPLGLARVRDGYIYEIEDPQKRLNIYKLGILDTVVLPFQESYINSIGKDYQTRVRFGMAPLSGRSVVTKKDGWIVISVNKQYYSNLLNSEAKKMGALCQ